MLSETLRLYPPAWILGRDALADVEAAGWRLRKGATVLMSQLVLHRSPEYFDRPNEFLPERWLADPPDLPQFAYFPFGGGSRKCIGDRFAWTEARIEWRHSHRDTRSISPRPKKSSNPIPSSPFARSAPSA